MGEIADVSWTNKRIWGQINSKVNDCRDAVKLSVQMVRRRVGVVTLPVGYPGQHNCGEYLGGLSQASSIKLDAMAILTFMGGLSIALAYHIGIGPGPHECRSA
jgi:hypothetical protein